MQLLKKTNLNFDMGIKLFSQIVKIWERFEKNRNYQNG